jgi:hypothetical protein
MMNRLHHKLSCGSVHFIRALDHTHRQVVGILHPAFGSSLVFARPGRVSSAPWLCLVIVIVARTIPGISVKAII